MASPDAGIARPAPAGAAPAPLRVRPAALRPPRVPSPPLSPSGTAGERDRGRAAQGRTPPPPAAGGPLPPPGARELVDRYLATLPEDILAGISLSADLQELHYSDVIRGRPELARLGALLQELAGTRLLVHGATDFARGHGRSGLVVASGDRSQVERELVALMAEARRLQASDIHITDMGSYGLVSLRIHGEMRRLRDIPAERAARLVAVAFNGLGQEGDAPAWSSTVRNDARIVGRRFLPPDVHSVRLHSEPVQSASARQGTFLAMRLLYDATRAEGSLEERLQGLGFTQAQARSFRELSGRTGLTVVAGATGHGKSTVLKHVMESLVAEQPDKAILSVEDPPEYPIVGVHQVQVRSRGGIGEGDHDARARAYTDAIAGALRADPDVLMVGEIRYPEAARAALDAALTGHAVWSTLHAADAFGCIARLESLLRALRIPNPLDSICDPAVLSGLACQRLVPRLCPRCRRRLVDLGAQERRRALPGGLGDRLAALARAFPRRCDPGQVFLRNPRGCPACAGLGIAGRTVAAEVVVPDGELLELLHAGERGRARKLWAQRGGLSLADACIDLVFSGTVDPAQAESRLGMPLVATDATTGGRA